MDINKRLDEIKPSTLNYQGFYNPEKEDGPSRFRINFAIAHLGAAALFSRQLRELEQGQQGHATGEFYDKAFAYASACVLACVSAVEAHANEVFFDRYYTFPGYPAQVLDKLWEDYEKKDTLSKYDFALVLRQMPQLQKGLRPYQDMKLLIDLRNTLVHFKPEWEDDPDTHRKLSRRLAQRVKHCPFTFQDDLIFPGAWYSHSCTQWAVKSSINFIDQFESKAGLESSLDDSRALLEP